MAGGLTHFPLFLVATVPLGGAAVAFVVGRFAMQAALLVAVATFVLSGTVVLAVLEVGVIVNPLGIWGRPLGIELRADGLSALLLGLVAIVMIFATVYARSYLEGKGEHARLFWPLWLFLWAALNALFLSEDAFNIYVTLELLGLSAVGLTAMGEGREAVEAALRYLTVGLVGSLLYLLAVTLVYMEIGTLDLPGMAERLAAAGPTAIVALGLATAGLLIKTALFPLHFWLPPAHAGAPAPVSAVLSALVVKASFYILLRFWFAADLTVPMADGASLFGFLGGAAVLWGATQALTQKRLKLMVAYSTVAQIGYLFLLFPIATAGREVSLAWAGAIYLVVSHAVAKAAMFLSAGTVHQLVGHDRISEFAGLASRAPLSVFAFAAAGVSLIGLPPSGGFIAKWLLLNGALANEQWLIVAVLLIGGVFASVYIFRVIKEALKTAPQFVDADRPNRTMEWTAAGLATVALLLGFVAPFLLPLVGGDQVGGALTVESGQ